MIVGRAIGWLLLAAALGAVGFEIFAAVQAGEWRPVAAGELWFRLDPASLNGAQAGIQRHVAPWLWDPVITWILLAPAWTVLAAPGALLLWACHERERPSHRRLG
jgi:hypothetical protein